MSTRWRRSQLRFHVLMLSIFALVFAYFVTITILSALIATYTPFQWVAVSFLTLSSALSLAWQVRVVWILRRRRDGGT
jgi:hypothetical protein